MGARGSWHYQSSKARPGRDSTSGNAWWIEGTTKSQKEPTLLERTWKFSHRTRKTQNLLPFKKSFITSLICNSNALPCLVAWGRLCWFALVSCSWGGRKCRFRECSLIFVTATYCCLVGEISRELYRWRTTKLEAVTSGRNNIISCNLPKGAGTERCPIRHAWVAKDNASACMNVILGHNATILPRLDQAVAHQLSELRWGNSYDHSVAKKKEIWRIRDSTRGCVLTASKTPSTPLMKRFDE